MKKLDFNFFVLIVMLFLAVLLPVVSRLATKKQDTRSKASENEEIKIGFKFAFRGITPKSICNRKLGNINIQVVNILTKKSQSINLSNYAPVEGEVNKFGDQVFEVKNLTINNLAIGSPSYIRVKGLFHTAVKFCTDNQSEKVENNSLCSLNLSSNKIYNFSDYPLIPGDINKDGKVNTLDSMFIKNQASKPGKVICSQKGDLNGDGRINSIDVALVLTNLNKRDEIALLPESEGVNSLEASTGNFSVNDYNLENFDNVSNFDSVLLNHDLSAYGSIKPTLSKVSNDVESNDGMLVSFTQAKENSYAQLFAFSKNILPAFKNSTDSHYVRMWFVADDNTDYDLTLILSSQDNQNYVDGKAVILTNLENKQISPTTGNSAGYGTDSSIRVSKGFKGWVSFPLKNIKIVTGKSNLIVLKEISHISLDVRPVPPRKNSYYVVDNILLTTKTAGTTSKTRYELSYRYDQVGIYYATWFDLWRTRNPQIYNITEIQNNNGQYGPIGYFHYWSEPQLGYYVSSDKEVIKTHMRQLVSAGIDFLVIDNTNLRTDLNNDDWNLMVTKPMTSLLDTLVEMRNNGEKTPYIVNWVGTFGDFNAMMMGQLDCTQIACNWEIINKLYNQFYTNEKYADLWVYWDDKPFMGTTTKISNPTVPITTRTIWALQQSTTNKEWTFRQQNNNLIYGKDDSGNLEQMSVSAALALGYCMSDPTYTIGRNHGLTFYNQWLNAYDKHPKVIFVGTWNEWGAQRIEYPMATCKDKCFTDEYTQEYSSDIEPMKGGHGNQYYQWLKKYIQDYKSYKNCPKLVESGY